MYYLLFNARCGLTPTRSARSATPTPDRMCASWSRTVSPSRSPPPSTPDPVSVRLQRPGGRDVTPATERGRVPRTPGKAFSFLHPSNHRTGSTLHTYYWLRGHRVTWSAQQFRGDMSTERSRRWTAGLCIQGAANPFSRFDLIILKTSPGIRT